MNPVLESCLFPWIKLRQLPLALVRMRRGRIGKMVQLGMARPLPSVRDAGYNSLHWSTTTVYPHKVHSKHYDCEAFTVLVIILSGKVHNPCHISILTVDASCSGNMDRRLCNQRPGIAVLRTQATLSPDDPASGKILVIHMSPALPFETSPSPLELLRATFAASNPTAS
nr:hypothetical protein CFP56_03671 [Quercus suber]